MRARLALLLAVVLLVAAVAAPALAPAWGAPPAGVELHAPRPVAVAAIEPPLPPRPIREIVARRPFRGPPGPSSFRSPESERPAEEARWRGEGTDGRAS